MTDSVLLCPPKAPSESFIRILIRNGFKHFEYSFTCNNCGNIWKERFGIITIFKFLVSGTKCPNCHQSDYEYEYLGAFLSIALALSLASIGVSFL